MPMPADAHDTGQARLGDRPDNTETLKALAALRVLAREILDHPGGHTYHAEVVRAEPPYLDVINRAHKDLREYIYYLHEAYCWSWREPIGAGGAQEAAEQIREVLGVRPDDG